jgi:integrase/recombinase XerD
LFANSESEQMQFRAAIIGFLRFCAVERQLSDHTLQAYASDLADFHKSLPRGAELADISEVTLKEYLAKMVGERKLTAATVRRRLACLRAFFRRLTELQQATNPFALWRPQFPRRRRLPRALSRSEVSSLLWSLKCDGSTARLGRDKCLLTAVRLMVGTGIRVGELCRLRIEDISPEGSAIRIHGKDRETVLLMSPMLA